VKINQKRKNAMDELASLLKEVHCYVDVIIVEGARDIKALRNFGCQAEIETLAHVGLGDYELAEQVASRYNRVLILTDYDAEGIYLNQNFSSIFEYKDVKIDKGLRNRIRRLMTTIGVYAIESLDNIKENLNI
jgi:5S rRNA maturation endonuclease (ribonuclease M5)